MLAEEVPSGEQLMEYFYHASVGIVQTSVVGQIRLINPIAVQLLMPLTQSGDFLDNLFVTLDPVLPDLRRIVEGSPKRNGSVLQDCRIAMLNGLRGHAEPVFFSLSIVKVAADALIVTIEDVSESAGTSDCYQSKRLGSMRCCQALQAMDSSCSIVTARSLVGVPHCSASRVSLAPRLLGSRIPHYFQLTQLL